MKLLIFVIVLCLLMVTFGGIFNDLFTYDDAPIPDKIESYQG